MRQQLPESSGYPLDSPAGRIYPGVPFDWPDLVAGCEPVAEGETGTEDEDGTTEYPGTPPAGDTTPPKTRRKAAGSEGADA